MGGEGLQATLTLTKRTSQFTRVPRKKNSSSCISLPFSEVCKNRYSSSRLCSCGGSASHVTWQTEQTCTLNGGSHHSTKRTQLWSETGCADISDSTAPGILMTSPSLILACSIYRKQGGCRCGGTGGWIPVVGWIPMSRELGEGRQKEKRKRRMQRRKETI